MIVPDLAQCIYVWHSSPVEAKEAIERDGVSVRREAVWVSLHPGVPVSFAKSYTHGFFLSSMALSYERWRCGWQGNCIFCLREGTLYLPVARAEMVEILTAEAVDARIVASGLYHAQKQFGERVSPFSNYVRLDGYHGWLDEQMLVQSCREVLEEIGAPAERRVLAGAYWFYLPYPERRKLQALAVNALTAVLAGEGALDGSVAGMACEVLAKEEEQLPLMGDWQCAPKSRLYFLRLWGGGKLWNRLPEAVQHSLDAQHLGSLEALWKMMKGEEAEPVAQDEELAQGLVDSITHGAVGNLPGKRLLALTCRLPPDLADRCLLELLRRLRWMPSQVRKDVEMALSDRQERLEKELMEIAGKHKGLPETAAQRILQRLA